VAGRKIDEWRGKRTFGFEDDLTEARFRALAARAVIPGPSPARTIRTRVRDGRYDFGFSRSFASAASGLFGYFWISAR
jgi:hypothetical protein